MICRRPFCWPAPLHAWSFPSFECWKTAWPRRRPAIGYRLAAETTSIAETSSIVHAHIRSGAGGPLLIRIAVGARVSRRGFHVAAFASGFALIIDRRGAPGAGTAPSPRRAGVWRASCRRRTAAGWRASGWRACRYRPAAGWRTCRYRPAAGWRARRCRSAAGWRACRLCAAAGCRASGCRACRFRAPAAGGAFRVHFL